MNKVFITKYSSAVKNNDLRKLGELRIHYRKSVSKNGSEPIRAISLLGTKSLKVEVSNGVISYIGNTGKSITVNTDDNILCPNDDIDLSIFSKYDLTDIVVNSDYENNQDSRAAVSFNLDDLNYSYNLTYLSLAGTSVTGDLSSVSNLTNLTSLVLSNTSVTGDLSSVSNLTNLTKLSLANTPVTGDLSSVSNLTNLTNLSLTNTSVTGDLSSVSNLTNLTNLSLANTSVTGDIINLSNLVNITKYDEYGDNNKIVGDVSVFGKMPNLTILNLTSSGLYGKCSDIVTVCKKLTYLHLPSTVTILDSEKEELTNRGCSVVVETI